MKTITTLSIFLLAGATGQAMADCTGTLVSPGTAVATLLSGKTVCGRPGPGYTGPATDRWQEEHHAGGALWDYKLGNGNPVDPREQVGTWSVSLSSLPGSGRVNYAYGTGGFTYAIFNHGDGTYSFCDGGSEKVVAFIQGGINAACGSFPP